ncbi:sodium channel modifier 1 [Pongo pygmaeus]|uniref:Sodium channel modifier 1 n=3 Tax=Pongo abelii TaxID=9601 RepID=H2N5W6_PONAB|nr:sodium channel modifier 1 isoform X1 [Pongo abelii]XP_054329960.1 sodium channel modifier 1 isoform X1 [Pongo pygmaeus]XP_054330062.1 sodium channel modifier 1 isoform X1 [Pongo pygmaeus]
MQFPPRTREWISGSRNACVEMHPRKYGGRQEEKEKGEGAVPLLLRWPGGVEKPEQENLSLLGLTVGMSFKREGDDWSQLNVLKKRRVGDLLASYIPEDEALMLRDGRFACAICPHRPVLDTLAMLTAHRAGKKHLSSLQLFYGKKQPGKERKQNPRHQNELRREETKAEAPLLTQTRLITQSALHRTPHYNSCCRRKYRPEAPGPSVSLSPMPPSEVELQSGKISREPEPGAGPQAEESATVSVPAPMSPTRRRALDHYLTLRSSGWIPDGRGRWVKDENVEFDSDEEEPPDLPLD